MTASSPRRGGGDMDALDVLVRRHQSWVFNLALRMVWRRDVAEDATQEILIKAVTKLSTFAGNSAFRTWLYRIAVNHLLNVRKSEMEEQKMTFTDMGASLDGVKDEDLPDERALPVETKVIGGGGQTRLHHGDVDVSRPPATAGVHSGRSVSARQAKSARKRWTKARRISGNCCRGRGAICINS